MSGLHMLLASSILVSGSWDWYSVLYRVEQYTTRGWFTLVTAIVGTLALGAIMIGP